MFVRRAAVLRQEEVGDRPRLVHTRPPLRAALRPGAEFERREHCRGLRETDPVDARQFLGRHTQELREAPLRQPGDDPAGEVQHVLAPAPRPQKDGEQLRVGELPRALCDKALARELARGQVTELHRPRKG